MFITSQTSSLDGLAAIQAAMLDAISTVHLEIKLAQGSFSPSPTSVPGTDFTEATFDGYAALPVAAFDAAYLTADGSAETIPTTIAHFAPTGTTTPNVIAGYWLVGSNGDYLGGEVFDTPVPLNSPTTALNLILKWQVSPATWSGVLVL